MAYLISIIVLFLTIVFGISVSVVGPWGIPLFWDTPSLILICIPAFTVSIMVHSLKGIKIVPILFGSQPGQEQQDVIKVFEFFGTLGNASILLGMIAFLISQVFMLADLSDPNSIGPNMAVGLISIIYALIIKLIAYSAQCRVRTKADIPHDMLNRDDKIWIAYLFAILPLLTFFILLFAMSKSC
jgi:flagellar motor component MotA